MQDQAMKKVFSLTLDVKANVLLRKRYSASNKYCLIYPKEQQLYHFIMFSDAFISMYSRPFHKAVHAVLFRNKGILFLLIHYLKLQTYKL